MTAFTLRDCLQRVGNCLLGGGVPSVLHVQTVYPVVCASRTLALPAMAFYEPNYESGRAVRWRIGLAGGNQNERMACSRRRHNRRAFSD